MTKVSLNTLRIRRTETMLTIIGVPDIPGTGAQIFRSMGKQGVAVTMIVQNAPDAGLANLTFTVDRKDKEKALDITRGLVEGLGAVGLMEDDTIARISLVGQDVLEDTVGLAGEFFSILAAETINVLAINSTADALSCIIEDANLEQAKKLLCQRFGLKLDIIS
jgi:aspartate kinase